MVSRDYFAVAPSDRKTTKDDEKTEKHPKLLDFVTFADRHGHAAGAARFLRREKEHAGERFNPS